MTGGGGAILVETGKRSLEAMPECTRSGWRAALPQSLNNNGFGIFIDGHPTTIADRPIVLDGASVDEDYFDGAGPADRGRSRHRVRRPRRPTRGRRHRDHGAPILARRGPARPGVPDGARRAFPTSIVGVVQDYKVDTPGEAPKAVPPPAPAACRRLRELCGPDRHAGGRHGAGLERELRSWIPTWCSSRPARWRTWPLPRADAFRSGRRVAHRRLRRARCAPRGHRTLRRHRVLRQPARARDRHPQGARCGDVRRRGHGRPARHGPRRRRRRPRRALAAAVRARLSGVLFVGAFDPLSFGIAFLVLASVSAVANWLPARRAARVDPMVALRGK
jgi:hypothetical protein